MIAQIRLIRVILLLALQWHFICFVKAQTDFAAIGDTVGCIDFQVQFKITSPSISPADSVKWYFGFGDTLRTRGTNSMGVIYTRQGQFSVTVIVNKLTPAIKVNYIQVHQPVNAFFRSESYGLKNSYMFIPYEEISDTVPTYFYMWSYFNTTTGSTFHKDTKSIKVSNLVNQENAIDSLTFNKGLYKVTLVLQDTYGCTDTNAISLVVADSIRLPNVFVPDGEKYYEIDPKDIGIVLHFQLFNRYGLLIFEQEAPRILWDGTTLSGKEVNTGVYYYVLKATQGDLSGKYNQKGFIHLFR
jgi:gliding motility-associated-like protein